jgi:hypothetical protein
MAGESGWFYGQLLDPRILGAEAKELNHMVELLCIFLFFSKGLNEVLNWRIEANRNVHRIV